MFDLASVQSALQSAKLDGWLLYDFRGLNVLARRVLDIPADAILSRRWFYFVPAHGEPRKLVHHIEPRALDRVPGGQQRLSALARIGSGRRQSLLSGCQPRGDGVCAAQRQSLCLARRCRHRRAGALLRRRNRAVRRSDPAVRGVLGRRAMGHAPGSGQAHALGLRCRLRLHRRARARAAARCARPKCSSASSITSPRTV